MKKVYLLILDGFGLGGHDKGDSVFQAKTPYLDKLFGENSLSKLTTHGHSVGLPEFQTGGSEVGHLTMGAGRPVKHILTIINDEIENGSFFEKENIKELFKNAKQKNRIHFVGMVSDGGIHSFLPHLFGLQKMADSFEIENVFIHAFLDGRDVSERTAKEYLSEIKEKCSGTIATVGGRFFAMDRDLHWERTKKEYDVLCDPGVEASSQSWEEAIDEFYANTAESDYYFPPKLLKKSGQIQEGDTVICFNFRTDRMRQITSAFSDPKFAEFKRPFLLKPENLGVFGNYCKDAQVIYSLSGEKIENTLGEVVSKQGLKQIRIAESEKKNHVTFFFSGEHKEEFTGEDRIIVPSDKTKPSFDQKPEMEAYVHTEKAIEAMKNDYSLVVHNYANGDIVGHSGKLKATIKAVEVLDDCLSKLIPEIQENGYNLIVTADHGNCEKMFHEDGSVHPSHTKSLVPCVYLPADGSSVELKPEGTLANIAPTILNTLGIEIPSEMTGEDLRK